MKKQASLSVILLSVLLITQFSCKKDDEKTAPTLPPESTFVMDMSDFDGDKKSGLATYNNWLWAATNVAVWNTILTVNLAIPVASFKEAFNHQAVYDPASDSWIWSYNVSVGGDTYLAELYGSYLNNGISWKMYITRSGSFNDFLWYTGESNLSGTEGNWLLKNDPVNNKDFILITWHKTSSTVADIKYENVLDGSSSEGTYILYGINDDAVYNAFYNIYNSANTNLTEIKWHRTNQDGRIKDIAHFSDANWHCWDGSHSDVVCE